MGNNEILERRNINLNSCNAIHANIPVQCTELLLRKARCVNTKSHHYVVRK